MVGRYAPSPTGELHLGNLRTALLAWLFARLAGSRFLLRIEDLDVGRVREPFIEAQLDDLLALGLRWDGEAVRQSQRIDLYGQALARLEAADRVYRCFCSRREVREAASAQHHDAPEGKAPEGKAPEGKASPALYPGTCRNLTSAESDRRAAAGEPFAVRLRADRAEITFRDRLHGERTDVVDDLVLHRSDGAFAYNLAVVVDDDEQGVEEVVRGDDLLPSTAGQALLCDLLNIPRPTWTHVPLVLGPDGERLAKRHGAVTLADLAEQGLRPADALIWMARSLDLTAPGEQVTVADLVGRFDPSRIPSEPTTFSGIRP